MDKDRWLLYRVAILREIPFLSKSSTVGKRC